MVQRLINNEEGYTLVEILMALAILSIVMGLVSATFIFVSGRMEAWKEQTTFYNDFHVVNNQLYQDLFRADAITFTDTTLSLSLNNRKRNYAWGNGHLRRKTESLFSTSDTVSLRIHQTDMPKENISVILYHLSVQSANRSMQDSAIIKVRQPVLWAPTESNEKPIGSK